MTLHVDRIDLADAIRTGVNPYLVGPYAPTHDELTLTDLEVVGEIPDDLNGVYVRNGPNPQHEPNGRYHWFDGDGMVHAVHIADGQATYRNRWVRTDGFEREREAGAPLWKGIIEPPAENPPGEPEKDTANTDVVFHNEKLLALWYRAGKPYALDPVTLETLGAEDFGGTLRCEVSAHAKADERTGELMFFDYGMEAAVHALRRRLPRGRRAPLHRHRPARPAPPARHGDHRPPLDPDGPAALQRPRGRRATAASSSSSTATCRAASASSRASGTRAEMRWFEAAPCFIYHSVNAWEEGDEVVMDVCRVKHPEPRTDLEGPLANVLSYLRLDAHLHRYRFNLRTGKTTEQTIDDDNSEFPSINNNVLGTPSRWAYTMHISPESTLLFDGLMKYDVHTGVGGDALVRGRPLGIGGAVRAAAGSDRGGRRLPRLLRVRRARGPLRGRGARRARRDRRRRCAGSSSRRACRSASTPPGCRARSCPGGSA